MIDFFKKLKVRTKLSILIGLLILGMIIYGILSSISFKLLAINGPYYKELQLSQTLIADILPPPAYIVEPYLIAFQMVRTTNVDELRHFAAKGQELQLSYDERYRFWSTNLKDPVQRRIFLSEAYQPAIEFFQLWNNQFIPAITAGNLVEAEKLLAGPMKKSYDEHRVKIDEVVRLATQFNATLEGAIDELGSRLQFFAIASWVVTVILGVLLATLLGYLISNQLRDALKKIRGTSQQIDVEMRAQSKKTLEEVASINEATSSLNGLNQSFQHTEELAIESNNRSKKTLEVSEEGNKLIKKMLNGLIQHKEKVVAILQHIVHLSEITKQIHNIAVLTGNITNQTNILALNAAVQAAQVKQQSESFSVIASEIRKLAEESKKFLLQIDLLADTIKTATDSTLTIAEESTKTVQDCIDLAQSSTEAFNSIIDIASTSFKGAEQVLVNVREQSLAVIGVLKSLKVANETTNLTLKGMGQVRQQLENLNAVSEELRTIV